MFKTTKYNDYFKENLRVFDALEFIALVTAHIPPKHKQLIRRYGLYASRTRGKWETQDHIVKLAPEGWKERKKIEEETPAESAKSACKKNPVGTKQQRSAWARLIKKVYGVDPLVCPWLHGRARNEVSDQPKCGSEMIIITIIMNPQEIEKILRYLVKIGWSQTTFAARHASGVGHHQIGILIFQIE